MAKVSASGSLISNSGQYGDDGFNIAIHIKRKTPSELKIEQLKRRKVGDIVDESLDPPSASSNEEARGFKKSDFLKNSMCKSTCMDAIYPVKKPTCMLSILSSKENAKENTASKHIDGLMKQKSTSSEAIDCSKNLFLRVLKNSLPSSSMSKVSTQASQISEKSHRPKFQTVTEDKSASRLVFCQPPTSSFQPGGSPQKPTASVSNSKGSMSKDCSTSGKVNHKKFCSVSELSLGNETLSKWKSFESYDVNEVLKRLSVHGSPDFSSISGGSVNISDSIKTKFGNLCSDIHVPFVKIPLDFTLKTSMWVSSSASVEWSQLSFQLGSWVYPQCMLTPTNVSALSLSRKKANVQFLNKRWSDWQSSLWDIFYMLRRNSCNIFYVRASRFVVMFIVIPEMATRRRSLNAYISRSTSYMRSLMSKHGVVYSMPFNHFKEQQATVENLSKTDISRDQGLKQVVDYSTESLLRVHGRVNVLRLVNILVNNRKFLAPLPDLDVPALYSPVYFQNSYMCSPEVKRKNCSQGSPDGGIEIKGSCLAPWIISKVCETMRAKGSDFKARYWTSKGSVNFFLCFVAYHPPSGRACSFVTDRASFGLNVVLEKMCEKTDAQVDGDDPTCNFDFRNDGDVVLCHPSLRAAFLKGFKYCGGSYTAHLSPHK